MHTATAAAYVVTYPKGNSDEIVLLGSYASGAEAVEASRIFRAETSPRMIVAPVIAAFVNARRVVAAF